MAYEYDTRGVLLEVCPLTPVPAILLHTLT
jgi:hypothetical protein